MRTFNVRARSQRNYLAKEEMTDKASLAPETERIQRNQPSFLCLALWHFWVHGFLYFTSIHRYLVKKMYSYGMERDSALRNAVICKSYKENVLGFYYEGFSP